MYLYYILFFLSSLALFLIEIYLEFYLTAFVQITALIILFYASCILRFGRISRMIILTLFLISYPVQLVIMITDQSTLNFIQWRESYFILSDTQNAFVILISAIMYLLFLLSHNLMSLSLNDKNNNFIVNSNLIKKIKKTSFKKKINPKIYNFYLWITILFLLMVLYVQNKFGWGAHGLPPYNPNIFKGIGLTVYLRDYFIPIILIFLLLLSNRISFFVKIVILFLSILAPATSLSKVTLIVYFLILLLAFQKDLIKDKKLSFSNNFNFIILFFWGIILYVLIMVGREKLIYIGEPINNQFYLLFAPENLNINRFINFFEVKHFFSLLERFLGFKELASVIYYKGTIYFEANFFQSLSLVDVSNLKTNQPREFTSNYSRGGVGVDWISQLMMTGNYMIIPILLILINFFLQIHIIKNSPKNFRITIELIMMIIFVRYAIDGNLIMIRHITILLFMLLLILLGLKRSSGSKTG